MKVIDASVILKWVLANEQNRKNALTLYLNHKKGLEKLITPSLALIEVANALVTKTKTKPATIKKDLQFIFEAELEIYTPDHKNIIEASRLAKKHGVTVYDILYAVVANNKKCELITADGNFIKKTGFKFVKHISEVKP